MVSTSQILKGLAPFVIHSAGASLGSIDRVGGSAGQPRVISIIVLPALRTVDMAEQRST